MREKRVYTWFLEPLDSQTNQAIAGEVPESNLNRGMRCADGRPHNLWECSYKIVAFFWKSKEKMGLRFKIYVKEGGGKIRDGSFLFKKRRRRTKRINSLFHPSPRLG